MAVRVLHSADWQIGQKATHVAGAADTLRKARLEAARAVIEAGNRERVDAILLAGDQFEDNLVEDRLVYAINEILAGSRAPVFVLPGNHDALTHDSVYFRASWQSGPPNVFLLKTSEPVVIPGTGAILLPAPIFQKKSSLDPTADLRGADLQAGGARQVRIGIAHGSLRIEGKYSEDDFPIALGTSQRLDLDYLALGHWHGHFVHEGKTAYSGTQETCNFGEKNSGQALLAEIAGPGAAPRLTPIRTGRLQWMTYELDFDLGADMAVQGLRRHIDALADPKSTLMRIRTRGRSGADVSFLLPTLEEELSARLLHFALERGDTSSAVIEGRLAELAGDFPIVESLIEGVTERGLPAEESGAALQLLFEILAAEAR